MAREHGDIRTVAGRLVTARFNSRDLRENAKAGLKHAQPRRHQQPPPRRHPPPPCRQLAANKIVSNFGSNATVERKSSKDSAIIRKRTFSLEILKLLMESEARGFHSDAEFDQESQADDICRARPPRLRACRFTQAGKFKFKFKFIRPRGAIWKRPGL